MDRTEITSLGRYHTLDMPVGDRGNVREHVIKPSDPDYPMALRARGKDLPLHVLGKIDMLQTAGIGHCGSRRSSQLGIELARIVGIVAAEANRPLVSGYAAGADTAGHLAALVEGGHTTAILAEGLGSKWRLRREYAELGDALTRMTIVSQYPPNARWTSWRAMQRNTTICALSNVLVAIEPSEKGGTRNAMITALRMNIPVIVVPAADGANVMSGVPRKHQGRVGIVHDVAELQAALDKVLAQAPVEQLALSWGADEDDRSEGHQND